MSLSINGKPLDDPSKIFCIAELSGNHGQNYGQAERLVAAAAEAGADAVKTQTFMAEEICADIPLPIGHNTEADAWFARLGVSRMRDLFRKGGFPREWHVPLRKCAEACGVEFLSTPFSVDAAKFLVQEVGVSALKIASGDLTFQPLLHYAGGTDLPIILSTGGATIEEIWFALDDIDYGATTSNARHARERVALLHCVSVYPCDPAIANLRVIQRWRDENQFWVATYGFSDHTLSCDVVPALAGAMGATIYEKHLTLDRQDGCVDSLHSLEPHEFAKMVQVIRQVPAILGSGIKEPHALELHDRLWSRRSPEDWKRPQMRAREGAWE